MVIKDGLRLVGPSECSPPCPFLSRYILSPCPVLSLVSLKMIARLGASRQPCLRFRMVSRDKDGLIITIRLPIFHSASLKAFSTVRGLKTKVIRVFIWLFLVLLFIERAAFITMRSEMLPYHYNW